MPKYAGAGDEERLDLLRHHQPHMVVDLGVGLWATPLPMDYDADGRVDLVVASMGDAYNGTYLFRNTGEIDPDTNLPLFTSAQRLGPSGWHPQASYPDGEPLITTPNRFYPDFKQSAFDKPVKLGVPGPIHRQEGYRRARHWRLVDYNGDGSRDIVVGIGYWGDYGWDDAYNEHGQWTRGPLRGLIYLLENRGTNDTPDYSEPRQLANSQGKPLEVFGMPSPNFADFTGDGRLDLICGEFLDGFTFFKNVGSRQAPIYEPGRWLSRGDRRVTMDLCMITPVAYDFDGDGWTDLVVGDEDGRVALVKHTGEVRDGMPIFDQPVYFRQRADKVKFGALSTPFGIDWNGDGRDDILSGNTAGRIAFIENLGGEPTRWAAPQPLEAAGEEIRIMAGQNGSIQGPAEAKWGYTTLTAADWNHDGLPDLLVNTIWGRILWYENVGTRDSPRLAAARGVQVLPSDGIRKPAWNWWSPEEGQLVTQWRTTPVGIDWNQDGLTDLVMLDQEGYLAFFRRDRIDGELVLHPGERVFRRVGEAQPMRLNAGRAGKSGRRKLAIIDLDGDGRRDLLLNGNNAGFLRNIGTDDDGFVVFEDMGQLGERRLSHHSTSPTVLDLDGDGNQELLIGAEDGLFYHRDNPFSQPAAVHLDTASLTVRGWRCEVATLQSAGRAYANRDYTWQSVPEGFAGRRYLRSHGGMAPLIKVQAKRDTPIFIATADAAGDESLRGWYAVEGARFSYTDERQTEMQIYRRDLERDERIDVPQRNWSGSFLILPENTNRDR